MSENIKKPDFTDNLIKSNQVFDDVKSSLSAEGVINEIPPKQLTYVKKEKISYSGKIIISLLVSVVGILYHNNWLGVTGSILALCFAAIQVIPATQEWISFFLTPKERQTLIGFIGLIIATGIIANYLGIYQRIGLWLNQFKYDEFGSWAEWVGALGQIMIAMLAVYVAWQQYVISKDLTIQQNRITQQQTIDAYFQGISDLVLGPDGLLEDWPQERAIAEGRTAAILGSVDSSGKAKILRFLSRSRLITPLRRDSHLGRPILDGAGGYAEDREFGTRVINLGVVLAGCNFMGQDLRWIDLSEANLVRADMSKCDLVKTNLSRTVLYEVNLKEADLKSVKLFYGNYNTASPRSRTEVPNYNTGEYTGAVIEKSNLTGVKNLSEENRYYCCCWGGEYTRSTIPGGCQGIPNCLEVSEKQIE
ncbi:MAG: pentapeptide repeat-containing protein [Cyanobacteria bacterium]|nr:pentapeptide repeat-containing protein [Cyanobacteria bacterium CG_2015-16_32_12]NCO79535.1 pentapeptide repeat-containing protein [Cyanobacteria bacterium CG_2015-22_32_23]NCQ03349.1 pentapeptide repeat-containing protein [Cyanobacteria bacterium CG_2015-09_32_10]NCQ43007.1 pentapeptide repeat-containing protein [Cyanobacteria bacterium CG_2015-04_32_10]